MCRGVWCLHSLVLLSTLEVTFRARASSTCVHGHKPDRHPACRWQGNSRQAISPNSPRSSSQVRNLAHLLFALCCRVVVVVVAVQSVIHVLLMALFGPFSVVFILRHSYQSLTLRMRTRIGLPAEKPLQGRVR